MQIKNVAGKSWLFGTLKGVAVAAAAAVTAILITVLVIWLTHAGADAVKPAVIAIKLTATVCGAAASAGAGLDKTLLRGALTGASFMMAATLIYTVCEGAPDVVSLGSDLLLGAAAGAAAGRFRGAMAGKRGKIKT